MHTDSNRLYLVRHGENTANLTLEFSHRKIDYPLTPKGVLQAEQTAACFLDRGLQEIYASPLRRARQTAEIIGAAAGLPVTVIEDFREVNVGDLEGQPPTAALWQQHNAIISAWMAGQHDLRFPGGENFHELLARAQRGMQAVLRGKRGRTIAVVGHGGIFSFTLPYLSPAFDPALLQGGMGNCAITELRASLHDETVRAEVLHFSNVNHLSGEAAKLVSGLRE